MKPSWKWWPDIWLLSFYWQKCWVHSQSVWIKANWRKQMIESYSKILFFSQYAENIFHCALGLLSIQVTVAPFVPLTWMMHACVWTLCCHSSAPPAGGTVLSICQSVCGISLPIQETLWSCASLTLRKMKDSHHGGYCTQHSNAQTSQSQDCHAGGLETRTQTKRGKGKVTNYFLIFISSHILTRYHFIQLPFKSYFWRCTCDLVIIFGFISNHIHNFLQLTWKA